MSRRWRALAWLSALACAHCNGASEEDAPPQKTVVVPVVGLELKVPTGWSVDPGNELEDPNRGGLALRMISTEAVSGSPRIDVVLDPANEGRTQLDDLIRGSLEDMAKFEKSGAIDIQHIERREIRIGPRRAYRVSHDYTMKTSNGEVALSQLATLFVLDGRGIAVTAGGRTELFHPQTAAIDAVLTSMQVVMPPAGTKPMEKDGGLTADEVADKAKQLVEPMVLED
ncbi:MAG: hypothetical protein AAF654_01360 [Myxococcota bacterium]